MKIIKTGLIANVDANEFINELTEATDKFQDDGYEVEIQYSLNGEYFSALILVKG